MITYLTATETARRLSVSRSTLYRWWDRGEGPPRVRLGHRWRVREDTLDAWVADLAAAEAAKQARLRRLRRL